MIQIFTMFSGGGNGEIAAIEAAKKSCETDLGVRFVGYSEFNPVCNKCKGELEQTSPTGSKCKNCGKPQSQPTIAVYRYHFKDHTNYGDATKIVSADLPGFGLLIAGFPCQSFSVAGKRMGFTEARGTLFFEIARILSDKRPAHFLLENVKGLLSHEDGKTFQRILGILADIGYYVEWTVVNSKHHGVPQNRERVFIIGHLATECRREVFPLGRSHGIDFGESEEESLIGRDVAFSIDANYGKGASPSDMESGLRRQMIDPDALEGYRDLEQIQKTKGLADAHRIYETGGVARTLKSQGGGQGAKTGLYEIEEPVVHNRQKKSGKGVGGKGHPKKEDGTTYALDTVNFQVIEQADEPEVEAAPLKFLNRNQKNYGDTAATVDTAQSGGVKVAKRIRRLTPVETERLQGNADDHTRYGLFDNDEIKEISDTHRYHIQGNAFTVQPVREILLTMASVGCISFDPE